MKELPQHLITYGVRIRNVCEDVKKNLKRIILPALIYVSEVWGWNEAKLLKVRASEIYLNEQEWKERKLRRCSSVK